MASFGFMVIRGAFAVAEHLAPRLAGRAAFQLFSLAPRRGRVAAAEATAIDAAGAFMREARLHSLAFAGGSVAAHDFAPTCGRRGAGTTLVLHGHGSRTEHMRAIIAGLTQAGCRVIALDLPGHGRSAGRRVNMASAVAAVRAAETWFGPFAAIVGHSFGGAVAVNAAVGSVRGVPPVATPRLVLVSAPSSMPAIFQDFARFLRLGTRTQTAVAAEVERVAGHPLESYVGALQLAGHSTPALVVHAPDDKEVPAREAEAFARAGPHVRLRWAPGLGHRRILRDAGVVADIVDFVTGEAGRAAA